jgi:hypothetical protein
MKLRLLAIRLAFYAGMKKFIPCLAVIAVTSVHLLNCSNLRAQSELSDQDPPSDPIFLQDSAAVMPPTSPDAPLIDGGMTIVTYTPDSGVTGSNTGGQPDVLPGLTPNQVVTVTVQFGVQEAGQVVQASALDGGTLTVPDGGLIVDQNGNVAFQFQVGAESGLYQIELRDDNLEMGVEFWVINSQAPADNPAVNLPQ